MSYDVAFRTGRTFARFLTEVEANRSLWHALAERAELFESAVATVGRAAGCWRLLVLADDWCEDAVSTLPVIARQAEASRNVDLRIVPRDRFPDLRDRHLTDGRRSIPVVILLDDSGRPRGTWGPRPRELQRALTRELGAFPKEDRYREIRRWYARDRGRATANEIAEMIEFAAASAFRDDRALRPCGRDEPRELSFAPAD